MSAATSSETGSSGYVIAREQVTALWDELLPLLDRHRAEVAPYPDLVLAPDFEAYAVLERIGRLRCWTVRAADQAPGRGVLVGYLAMMVGPCSHYTGMIMAYQDAMFIDRQHRGGGVGLRLLRQADQDLAAEGVHIVAQRTNSNPRLHLGRLFARLGYVEADQTWLKRLDRPDLIPHAHLEKKD